MRAGEQFPGSDTVLQRSGHMLLCSCSYRSWTSGGENFGVYIMLQDGGGKGTNALLQRVHGGPQSDCKSVVVKARTLCLNMFLRRHRVVAEGGGIGANAVLPRVFDGS